MKRKICVVVGSRANYSSIKSAMRAIRAHAALELQLVVGASAGTLLSLAGKKRYITENSYMLIHELRSGTWGKYSQMAEDIENSRDLMTHIRDYYVKYTNMSADELDEQLKRDVCWNAATCLEKGLVDEII